MVPTLRLSPIRSLASNMASVMCSRQAYFGAQPWCAVGHSSDDEQFQPSLEGNAHQINHKYQDTLSTFRTAFPKRMWHVIEALFPDRKKHAPTCIDIAIGAEGRGGIELNRRGFQVISVESDPSLLARTFRFAQAHRANIELITARGEQSLLGDGTADLVTCFHGLHLLDTQRALAEANRVLKLHGKLIASWNDRDLDNPFIVDLETLLETHIPSYSRHEKQHDVDSWTPRLSNGHMFKLEEYVVVPNPLHMRNVNSLLDLLDVMSFVRTALRGEGRKRLHEAVRQLVERSFGRGPFELPLETKLFVLEKQDGSPLTAHPPPANSMRSLFSDS